MGLLNSQSNGGARQPFGVALSGREALEDTVNSFLRSKMGMGAQQSSTMCAGCGAPLSGDRHQMVRCEYCDRETQLP